ncbi:uncharacterized protein NPIL_126581 [Nephila pilipes]|uniref:C2H2-type domain-containing protein n=1 Tax=Nephila pilipes TaxID=299642 RepID=A0A8X6QG36_NEPPI|nr:uncharacterized protein NPIL_126581 [Nephila pilipes]
MATSKKDDPNKPFSSLSYQIFLVFGWWSFIVFIILETVLLIFKRFYFVYPSGNLLFEVALLLFLFGIESIRNFLGKKGNLTERLLSVVLSLLLTVPEYLGSWSQLYSRKRYVHHLSSQCFQDRMLFMNRKIYSCPYCSYSTPGRGNLKRHNLIHSGERPYVCNLCSKSFRQKTHLKHHLLVHIK